MNIYLVVIGFACACTGGLVLPKLRGFETAGIPLLILAGILITIGTHP